MNKPLLSLLSINLLLNGSVVAQEATDQNCQENVFYGSQGTGVHYLQTNISSIDDIGTTAPSSGQNLLSLAFGNDITENSNHRTFYSSVYNSIPGTCEILRYDGSSWITILIDSVIYHNAGGYGPFIYYQHMKTVNAPNDQCISRLNSNGTLTRIFTDTSLVFSVADIAVDSAGQIYCFRGPAIGNTTEMLVLDVNGNIVNSFSTNLNNLSTLYGAFFLHDTLFLGWGTTSGSIFPLLINGSSASLGTAYVVPPGNSYNDLANCHELTGDVTAINNLPKINSYSIYPNPSADRMLVTLPDELCDVKIFNSTGQLISVFPEVQNVLEINLTYEGIYFVSIQSAKENIVLKAVKKSF